jgi:O-antigen/teichoic acid export membrane protein
MINTAVTGDNLALLDDRDAPEVETSRPIILRSDSLAESVVALIVLAVAQRAIGFVRSLLVCDWLESDQLGEWDLANRFLLLAAPLVVLGLPGTFGRYLEHYRQRGLLRAVLMRTSLVCAALACLAILGMSMAPEFVSDQVFGHVGRAEEILILVGCLLAVIAYNYLTEMLTALRMVRVSSIVQFVNTAVFAALSVAFLAVWRADAMAIVAAYGGSCLLLVLVALGWLAWTWPRLPRDQAHLERGDLWAKLLPFAVWVWTTNLLYNLFEVVDRYMVVHYGNLSDPQALIGQYHSAQVVPLLMVSVAGILGGMILPHLAHDWEAGRREHVNRTLNLTIKLLGLAMFAGATIVLLLAPLLFETIWRGKFPQGQSLFPLALLSCAWLGLATVTQIYLWCAEKARWSCMALGVGLAANVALNLFLIPYYGLGGAVAATTIANAVVLAILLWLNRTLGFKLTSGTWIVLIMPVTLLLGPLIAAAGLISVVVLAAFGNGLLDNDEKGRLAEVCRACARRFSSIPRTTS